MAGKSFYNIKMFEARLSNGAILKKLIEAIKDLVADVNFDISNDGINL